MIFYIHGFNSLSTGSKKITDFSKFLNKEVRPLDYNSFDTFENNFNKLISETKEFDEKIFIGTSLGGFYASMLAFYYESIAIMLNPAVEPNKTLKQLLGEHYNYTTGEKGVLMEETVNSYPSILIPKKEYIILNAGDEVIPIEKTIKHIKDKNYIVFPGGGHRFEDVEEISRYIKEYLDHTCLNK
jgi:hypothetical protein